MHMETASQQTDRQWRAGCGLRYTGSIFRDVMSQVLHKHTLQIADRLLSKINNTNFCQRAAGRNSDVKLQGMLKQLVSAGSVRQLLS